MRISLEQQIPKRRAKHPKTETEICKDLFCLLWVWVCRSEVPGCLAAAWALSPPSPLLCHLLLSMWIRPQSCCLGPRCLKLGLQSSKLSFWQRKEGGGGGNDFPESPVHSHHWPKLRQEVTPALVKLRCSL